MNGFLDNLVIVISVLLVLCIVANALVVISRHFIKKTDVLERSRRVYLSLCLIFVKAVILFFGGLIYLGLADVRTSARVLGFIGLAFQLAMCFGFGYVVFKMYREMWLGQTKEMAS